MLKLDRTRPMVVVLLIMALGMAVLASSLSVSRSGMGLISYMGQKITALYYSSKGITYHPAVRVDPKRTYQLEVWVTEWPVFWHDRTYTDYLQYVAGLFSERYPNVTVTYHQFPITGVLEELQAAIDSGRPPDVYSGPFDPGIVRSGLQIPVTLFATAGDLDNYDPIALSSLTIDDQIWAWPRWYEPRGWLVNPKFLESAGLEPRDVIERGWTWDQASKAAGRSGTIMVEPSNRIWLHDLEMNSGPARDRAQNEAEQFSELLAGRNLLVTDPAKMQGFVADMVSGRVFAIASAGPGILRYFADAEFDQGFTRMSPLLIPVPHKPDATPVPPYDLEVTAAFVKALPHPAEDYKARARLAAEFSKLLCRTELPWLSQSLKVIPANSTDRANWIAQMQMNPLQAGFVSFFLENAAPLTGP